VGLENVLLKIFKFFDLDGTGFLKKTDFIKAIAKAGVILSDIEVINLIFY
jgi:Ca2+-binding EF-hand superfamily protein